MDDNFQSACTRYIDRAIRLQGKAGFPVSWTLVAVTVRRTGRRGASLRRLAYQELGYPKKQSRKVAA